MIGRRIMPAMNGGEGFTEETLYKVYGALRKDDSLTEEQATDAIMRMQNAGILFRERVSSLTQSKTIITRGTGRPNIMTCAHCRNDRPIDAGPCPICGHQVPSQE